MDFISMQRFYDSQMGLSVFYFDLPPYDCSIFVCKRHHMIQMQREAKSLHWLQAGHY